MARTRLSRAAIAVACGLWPATVAGQQPTPPQPPPGQPPPSTPPPASPFSGIVFGNYQYHAEHAPDGSTGANRFDLDRAYLTYRLAAGSRAGVRVTADLFKSPTTGYDLRLKYAYLQYDFLKRGDLSAFARAGILHTVEIDHEENYWPRWIAQVATERARFFSSADVGVATQVNLPRKFGEIYATITDGPGYANAGVDDRFKDFALRVSLTPLARRNGILKTLTFSPWVYRGDTASKFAASVADPATGQLGAIGRGLKRNRWGVFGGLRNSRLSAGAEYAERMDQTESGENTAVSPVAVATSTGRVVSAFAVIKPFLLADSASTVPLGVVARWDDTKADKAQDASTRFVIAGLTWDLTSRAAIALDYQEQRARRGASAPSSKVYFAHFVVNF